jgi:HEAT repeat protein
MSRPWPPVEQLLREIEATQARVRARAARGLGESGDPRGVDPLIRALADDTVVVRRKAALALGQLRDPRAIRPLIAALHDIDAQVRGATAAALKKLGSAAYALTLDAFQTGDEIVRCAALGVLARSRSAATTELLIDALDDPALPVRMEATRFLAQRRERKAVDRLMAALTEPDLCLWLYVWALGEIGDPRAFKSLERMLDARDFHVQSAAVKALRTLDNARAVDLFYQRLEDTARPDRDRFARVLANLDLLDAIQSLLKTAAGRKREVLAWVQERLRQAQAQMQACTRSLESGDSALEPNRVEQAHVELMREIESELRELARKPREIT